MGHSLIDKAVETCGSGAELARRIGVSKVTVHLMQSGKAPLSPEVAALCAEVIGADPYREAAKAMVEGCKDPKKAERLTRAFHLPRLTGGVAMLLISVISAVLCPNDASAKQVRSDLTVYTLWQLWYRIVKGFVLMARGTIGATDTPGTRTHCQAGNGHCGLYWS